jgi:hypothetical protein
MDGPARARDSNASAELVIDARRVFKGVPKDIRVLYRQAAANSRAD